jgi:hypothetical protein
MTFEFTKAAAIFRRRAALWLCCATLCFRLQAQEPAVVTFTLDFPGSQPDHYVISISSDGHSTYDSNSKLSDDSEGDPFHLDFVVFGSAGERIFDLAKRAHYFQGELDSKKRNLASTGTKTLAYRNAKQNTQASYNYSPIPAVQELTSFFQNLSSTLEFGHRIEYFYRYQKLALDEELKRLEDAGKQNGLDQLKVIAPILQKVADDPSVINPVRARAQRLLQQAAAPSKR